MLLPETSVPPLERARSVSGETPCSIWALSMNSTSESASQAPTATPTHLATPPGVSGLR